MTGDSYEYDGKQKPLAVRNEKITVAGGSPVKIEIRSTEHGPIVSGLDGTAFPVIASEYPTAAGFPATAAPEDPEADASATPAATAEATPAATTTSSPCSGRH